MTTVTRRKVLKSGTALIGGMAGILATGRAPAFAQGTTVHWLRWNDFVPSSDKVLREQQLEAMFSPDAVQKRAAFGKIVRADLLLLVRQVQVPAPKQGGQQNAKAAPSLEIVACETHRGLRLLERRGVDLRLRLTALALELIENRERRRETNGERRRRDRAAKPGK